MKNAKDVLIVGDRLIYRMGMKALVESVNYRVTGEVGTDEEGWLLASKLRPDIVMIDLQPRQSRGVTLIRKIAGKLDTRIIALSAFAGSVLALRVIRAGAIVFVARETKTEEILKCLHTVSCGGSFLDESVFLDDLPDECVRKI